MRALIKALDEASAEMNHYMGLWDSQMGKMLDIPVLGQSFVRKFAAPHTAAVQSKVNMGGRIKKFTIPGPKRDEVGLRIRYIGKVKSGGQFDELIAYVIFDGGPESPDSGGPGLAGDTASVFVTHETWSPAEKARTSRLVYSSVNSALPQTDAMERTISARLAGWAS